MEQDRMCYQISSKWYKYKKRLSDISKIPKNKPYKSGIHGLWADVK